MSWLYSIPAALFENDALCSSSGFIIHLGGGIFLEQEDLLNVREHAGEVNGSRSIRQPAVIRLVQHYLVAHLAAATTPRWRSRRSELRAVDHAHPGYTLCLAMKSAAGSLLIPGSSGAGTSPFTIFCRPPDSM